MLQTCTGAPFVNVISPQAEASCHILSHFISTVTRVFSEKRGGSVTNYLLSFIAVRVTALSDRWAEDGRGAAEPRRRSSESKQRHELLPDGLSL